MSPDSLPPLGKYRFAGVFSFLVAAVAFVVAFTLELASPGGRFTRLAFWTGVALIALFFATVYFSLFRVLSLRDSSQEERKEARLRATWGGPMGALAALWDLTSRRR